MLRLLKVVTWRGFRAAEVNRAHHHTEGLTSRPTEAEALGLFVKTVSEKPR